MEANMIGRGQHDRERQGPPYHVCLPPFALGLFSAIFWLALWGFSCNLLW